jgi:hypothetical protein
MQVRPQPFVSLCRSGFSLLYLPMFCRWSHRSGLSSPCPSSPCSRYAVQMAPQPSVPFHMFCRWSHRSGISSPYPSYTLQIGPQPSVPLPMRCRSALCTPPYALQIGRMPSVLLVCRLALCNLPMLYPSLYSAD